MNSKEIRKAVIDQVYGRFRERRSFDMEYDEQSLGAALGLSAAVVRPEVEYLCRKGILERVGFDVVAITEAGVDVAEAPETGAPLDIATKIEQHFHNVNVKAHTANVGGIMLNINEEWLLNTVDKYLQTQNVPEHEKEGWREKFRELAKSPLTLNIINQLIGAIRSGTGLG